MSSATLLSLSWPSNLSFSPTIFKSPILPNQHHHLTCNSTKPPSPPPPTPTFISNGTLHHHHHFQSLLLMELEPLKLGIAILGPFLSAFGFLFMLRIVMSWYPKLPLHKFPYLIAYAPTEPFLIPTRKLIPPLAGVDVTPVVWFALLSFLNEILLGPQGLLILLLSQQQVSS
ncbi:protein COFACTOR ASSEMBLY OF COMPLEX C SUBUNIT B CCB3, chloroplastic [Andrographis paniculata]|uniref:protein COFACTOR ASSEMBLY OF COMPLEX C SUBUNIT B CCB3, chloroplastic n=1 Tax=Andrographis paniculata TaxID=175694 RepID=UPI0021E9617D|nr:protein COFACTOR ASSEMBLY OF COMPLEX C SUBUNIT B CCB3, chloroplastic [Andrographis paniculata]